MFFWKPKQHYSKRNVMVIVAIIQKELHTTQTLRHHSPGAASAFTFNAAQWGKAHQNPTSPHLLLLIYLFLLSIDILPKQETFPETDAKNCTKATSITGLSVTARSSVWGFNISPALVSASGTITCRTHRTRSAAASGPLLPGRHGTRTSTWAQG